MANGGIVLELDEALSQRLTTAAATAGKPALDYARSLIVAGLDEDWVEDDRRFAEWERTGVSVDAKAALLDMRRSLAAELKAKI